MTFGYPAILAGKRWLRRRWKKLQGKSFSMQFRWLLDHSPTSCCILRIFILNTCSTVLQGEKFKSNKISTAKYNLITFIPRFLFEQFRRWVKSQLKQFDTVHQVRQHILPDNWVASADPGGFPNWAICHHCAPLLHPCTDRHQGDNRRHQTP